MPLGIEQNSIAPSLIQNSGSALVQGIRQIGQQISGHLTEMQTRKDLAGFAEEMQGLNPESTDFPVQLTQVASRHPMAIRDERGQMAMSVLGKAHGQWQASQQDALAFQRAMQMQGVKDTAAASRAAAADTRRNSRPVSVYGVGLVDPLTGETVVAEGERGGGTTMPFRSTPQGIMDARTGQITAPLPTKTATPYQEATLRQRERRDRLTSLNQQATRFDKDIDSHVRAYEKAYDREIKATDEAEKLKHQNDKTEIGKIADALKSKKAQLLDEIGKLTAEDAADVVEPELGEVPENAASPDVGVVPPAGTIPPAASSTEMIMVFDPEGKPGKVRASQLEAALQNGYRRR